MFVALGDVQRESGGRVAAIPENRALRGFVGRPSTKPTTFLREEKWGTRPGIFLLVARRGNRGEILRRCTPLDDGALRGGAGLRWLPNVQFCFVLVVFLVVALDRPVTAPRVASSSPLLAFTAVCNFRIISPGFCCYENLSRAAWSTIQDRAEKL